MITKNMAAAGNSTCAKAGVNSKGRSRVRGEGSRGITNLLCHRTPRANFLQETQNKKELYMGKGLENSETSNYWKITSKEESAAYVLMH